MTDNINPNYYKGRQLEVIELSRLLPFSLGNAVKYIMRFDRKHQDKATQVEDLRKALWYVEDYFAKPELHAPLKNTDLAGALVKLFDNPLLSHLWKSVCIEDPIIVRSALKEKIEEHSKVKPYDIRGY